MPKMLSRFQVYFLGVLAGLSAASAVPGKEAGPPLHSTTGPAHRPLPRPPPITYNPKTPHRLPPFSPHRERTCHVYSYNNGTDDSHHIINAINTCNNSGHIVFAKNTTYTIGKALDLSNLHHLDIEVQGTIKFTNDTDYWQKNSFKQVFQNATTFFNLGGEDVNVFGDGTIDGNGQVWYDAYAANIYTLRPTLFGVVGLKGGSVRGLKLKYSPTYYFWVANSTDVVFDGLSISGGSTSANVAKNTDGWDTYRSSHITIQNSVIQNGDGKSGI
jgi:galacturan 1,4-alpha-galacturonidase